jgi:uncharacterized protein YndB with AHSA1/START domain
MITKTEITHSFNAPRDFVFKAFTESTHLQNWWGPKGWAFDISKFELRQNGVFHYSQTSPDGNVMWVKFIYHEVNVSDKLVYTSFFSDEKGTSYVLLLMTTGHWKFSILLHSLSMKVKQ